MVKTGMRGLSGINFANFYYFVEGGRIHSKEDYNYNAAFVMKRGGLKR